MNIWKQGDDYLSGEIVHYRVHIEGSENPQTTQDHESDH